MEEESGLEAPEAESTTIAAATEEAERNESTEADRSFHLPSSHFASRMQLMKKHSKRILKKQSLRLKKAVVRNRLVDSTAADIASVQVDLTITIIINDIINTTITINITNITDGDVLASHHHHHHHYQYW